MYPQKGKLTRNLDKNTLNLTVLQRVDPCIKEILITVTHVSFHELGFGSTEWSKKNVEGSLYVVKRETEPRFQFIVMNRRNADNLVENICEYLEYDVQTPCLFYRSASQEVNCMWFDDKRECEKVANLLSRILNSCSKALPTRSKVSPAKSKLNELEPVLSPSVFDGLLEQFSSSINTYNPDIQEDPCFINSFNTAMNIGDAPNDTIYGKPYNSVATTVSTSSPQGVARPTLPTTQIPSNLSASRSIMSMLEASEPNTKHSTNFATPSLCSPVRPPSPLVIPLISPSMLTTPPSHNTPVNMPRIHSAPLLQSFPPPPTTSPPSLTPTSLHTPFYGPPVISREKFREVLQLLVQDNHFIDIVYRAVMKGHQT